MTLLFSSFQDFIHIMFIFLTKECNEIATKGHIVH